MGKLVQIRHGPATVKQEPSCKSDYQPWTYKPVFLRGKDNVSGHSVRMDSYLLNMYPECRMRDVIPHPCLRIRDFFVVHDVVESFYTRITESAEPIRRNEVLA
ncbi:hypothetical protein ABIE27_004549 [Paenibacillus sp. 4624]|jgi:hypothetical protein